MSRVSEGFRIEIAPMGFREVGTLRLRKNGKLYEFRFLEGYSINVMGSHLMLGIAVDDIRCDECDLKSDCEDKDGCHFFYPLLVREKDGKLSVCFQRYSFYVPGTNEDEVKKLVSDIAGELTRRMDLFSRIGKRIPYKKLNPDERWFVDSLATDCPPTPPWRRREIGDLREYIEEVKKRLKGRGRAYAEWYRFEEGVGVGGARADFFAHGNTGMLRAGILTRLLAARTLPRWEVATILFGYDEPIKLKHVLSSIRSAKSYMKAKKIKWVWLALLSFKGVTPKAEIYVSRFYKKELGITLVNMRTRQLTRNPVFTSKPMDKIFKP